MLHGDFEVRRRFDRPVAEVWRGFVDPDLRARWRRIPGRDSHLDLDLREGGHELLTGSFAPGGVRERIRSTTHFIDVVERQRLVYAYDVRVDELRRWASLVTVTFDDRGATTTVAHHEQYVFLAPSGDGADDVAHLRGSVPLAWNALEAALT